MKFTNWILESEFKFWNKIYKNNKTHWTEKQPSNLTKFVIKKFGPFDHLLEIGYAAGIDSFLFAQNSKKITAIDLIPDAIKLAKNNLKKENKEIQNKITFEVGDVENLKYKDNTFDFVFSLSVLHSTNISKSILEISRVLKNNKYCVLYVYIKPGKEGIDKTKFQNELKKYFEIIKEKEHEIKEDDGGDFHIAYIVELKNEK